MLSEHAEADKDRKLYEKRQHNQEGCKLGGSDIFIRLCKEPYSGPKSGHAETGAYEPQRHSHQSEASFQDIGEQEGEHRRRNIRRPGAKERLQSLRWFRLIMNIAAASPTTAPIVVQMPIQPEVLWLLSMSQPMPAPRRGMPMMV